MIRAVIDSRVLVSYALTGEELLSRLVDHWERESFVHLTSAPIIEKLRRLLQHSPLRGKMVVNPAPLLRSVEVDTQHTPGELDLEDVSGEPWAEILIASALEEGADYVVTWDRDLLNVEQYRGIEIIKPEEFVAILDALNSQRQGTAVQDNQSIDL